MLNNYLNRPRKKAFLGAIIGAIAGIGASIYGANKSKRAQEQQYALQRNAELRNTGLTSASNLTQAYANADELDKEFRSRFLRYGGRRKALFGDYIPNYAAPTVESYGYKKMGGRSKFEDGGSSSSGYKWSSSDTTALINGLGSAGSSFVTSLIGQAQQHANYINAINPLKSKKDDEAVYDSAARSEFLNNYYRTAMMRLGGRRR